MSKFLYWDRAKPNKIFRAHKYISRCFKNGFSSSKMEKYLEKNIENWINILIDV
jgi:hypothetical protein